NVATVSGTGVVLAVAEGTTTIRAVGTTSNSAGLMELTVVPTVTSLLLWDGENGYTGANGVLNSAEAFRGTGCLEATPTKFSSPTIGFIDYPGYRSDLSALDEIWFFAKADMTGRTTDFRVRGLSGQSNTVNIDGYIDGGALDLTYRLVRIPIADLQTDTYSLDNVENIFFGVALPSQGHKFYIDDVWAVSLAAFDVSSYPLMGSVPALNFGDVTVHGTASQDITLTNIGTGTLSVHKVSITGAQAEEFFVSETAFDIAPGATHALTVSFSPATVLNKATGDKSAALVLAHSLTPMSSSTAVSLRGRAVSPAISVSDDAMDFGSIAIGQSSTRTLSLSNPGNAPLTVSSVMTSEASFTASPTSFTLNPDTSQVVSVVFTPTTSASYTETVTLLSDAGDTETIAVDLAATGLPADTVGVLAVEADGVTSSSVRLSWARLDQAASVRVYLGPEPSATANADLPLQTLLDTLASDATTYTALDLAPAVDVFFHIEVLDSGSAVLAEGNAYAHTVGGPLAVLDNPVREIHLVAPNVLQVIVANDAVHSFSLRSDVSDGGIDRIVGDTGEDLQAGSWSITRNDGSPIGITSIYRQSVPTGTPYYESGVDVDLGATTGLLRLNLIDLDHQLYFVLEEPVGNREILTVLGPEITRETMSFDFEIGQETFQPSFILPFSDRHLETTVIQVNQVGYSPIATERYAYISGWMGDGGPLSLTGFPSQASVLVDDENALLRRTEAVTGLLITERSAMDNDSGTEVREIDLSTVPAAEGVVYRVYIPGVGVSFPTQVSETAVFKAFYVSARGLFFNRWGRDLKPEWTEWSPRPPDHPFVFTADTGDFLLERTAFTENTPQTGQRTLAGGHHDAADYDIRGQHFLVPLYLMRIYELHPETFLDSQLAIPESGNGIPDLLDEILWSLSAWEQLQEEDGGVRGGVESFAHPSLINFADLDALPYWTFTRSAYHTMRVAGLFAQAARLVEPFEPDKSAELLGRAVAAYQYAMANGVTEATTGPPMYAARELYRMTGEAEYRDVFES
ncbi:MAG: choice-of-anchor D domain-containing protein, partial [Candidatus Hydrogenedentes bacterium]|nr:choice-of-anchor D domain-containing protein [Candidatus Hydrogenedentota bacterium]